MSLVLLFCSCSGGVDSCIGQDMSNRGCYHFRQRVQFDLTIEPAHDKITIRSKNSHYRMILDDPQESRPIKWLTSKSAL